MSSDSRSSRALIVPLALAALVLGVAVGAGAVLWLSKNDEAAALPGSMEAAAATGPCTRYRSA